MKLRIVAIVQARMGSTRLPGKALLPLGGDVVLGLLLRRLKQSRLITRVVVATSTRQENDSLAAFCARRKVPCFRGDEEDVLGRFAACAEQHDAEVIVRVTGDEPLLDPEIVDRTIKKFLSGRWDVVSTGHSRCVPKGLDCEVFSRKTLRKLLANSRSASDREHVTSIAYRSSGFKVAGIRDLVVAQEYRPEIVLTLDDAHDYAFLRRLVRIVGPRAGLQEIIAGVDSARSAYYRRAKPRRPYRVAYVITACKEYGTGHVHTARAVTEALAKELPVAVSFFATRLPGVEIATAPLRRDGSRVTIYPSGRLLDALKRFSPDIVLVDIDSRTARRDELQRLAEKHPVAYFDYVGIEGFSPAIIFNRSLLFNEKKKYAERIGTQYYTGTGFFPLSAAQDCATRTARASRGPPRRFLVTMGGSDPRNLTLRIVQQLRQLRQSFAATIICGALYGQHDRLRRVLDDDARFRVLSPQQHLLPLMAANDVILCNSGRTAYEACAVGVPMILYPQNLPETMVAKEFHRLGAGSYEPRTRLSALLPKLTPARRRRMQRTQRLLLDGNGAERVASRLSMYLTNHCEER